MLNEQEFSNELDERIFEEMVEFIDDLMAMGKTFEEAVDFSVRQAVTWGKPQYTKEVIEKVYHNFKNGQI